MNWIIHSLLLAFEYGTGRQRQTDRQAGTKAVTFTWHIWQSFINPFLCLFFFLGGWDYTDQEGAHIRHCWGFAFCFLGSFSIKMLWKKSSSPLSGHLGPWRWNPPWGSVAIRWASNKQYLTPEGYLHGGWLNRFYRKSATFPPPLRAWCLIISYYCNWWLGRYMLRLYLMSIHAGLRDSAGRCWCWHRHHLEQPINLGSNINISCFKRFMNNYFLK